MEAINYSAPLPHFRRQIGGVARITASPNVKVRTCVAFSRRSTTAAGSGASDARIARAIVHSQVHSSVVPMEVQANENEKGPFVAKPLKKLTRIAKRPPVDIEFQNLCYSVSEGGFRAKRKQILKSINGKFISGNLTAILGPSGAGKSTLLNILAGYVTIGVKGCIKVNDRPRQMKLFHKLSTYIMQENILQPHLTVLEAMMIAAKLKLGNDITNDDKIGAVHEVLSVLGLTYCSETMSEYLSGGQRKRLIVALELVNNPPVIFLDEPTTGLDSVSIKQCIDLLHTLTRQGRTIVCTIHQPPASVFSEFDQVYFMSNGCCMYNGSPGALVSFLTSSGFACPSTYSPADYIIELVQHSSENTNVLTNKCQNGRLNLVSNTSTDSLAFVGGDGIYCETGNANATTLSEKELGFPTTFWTQFTVLLGRMFLQMKRNKSMLAIQFFHHLVAGLLMGGIFFGIGNNAAQMMANFKYCISVVVFFMYTYVMVPVLLFPLEVKLLEREYFNRWYGLKAYYFALTIAAMPLLIVFGMIFIIIVYILSDQPWDLNRFILFALMGIIIGLTSQGLGFSIGSICSITNGSIVGPSVLAPLLALAVYGMGYRHEIEPVMKFFMTLSYVRFGLVGFLDTLLNERPQLDCFEDELYCHYKDPQLLMRDMGMTGTQFGDQLLGMLGYMVLFRLMAFLTLKYRLTSDFSVQIVNYASKILKHE